MIRGFINAKESTMRYLIAVATLMLAATGWAGDSMAPPGASCYIISPKHGETVSSPFKVVFGLSGMGIAPAGVERDNTGHHHLIIDSGLPSYDAPIPADDRHRHFGGGQTETLLELPPGRHTLQLLLADYLHRPHKTPVVSEQISIVVR